MKAQKGSRGTAVLSNCRARWGGLSTPRNARLNPEKILGTDCTGDWVDPKAGLDRGRNKKP